MAQRWQRIILHADMDAFFAAVEQMDRPELRGRPVLVGGPGPRSVVSTASYEARPFGVGSAMSMALARRRCPEAIVVPPRFARYKEVSNRVMEVFSRFSPRVEPLSLDEAFLDMSGATGLFGPPEAIGQKIRREVFHATGGLTVSVGIARSKFVAKVASDHRKPDGLTVVHPEREPDFLHPLPVGKLWGVGPKAQEKLHALGLRTIGDVARASSGYLVARLGTFGAHIHRLAQGDDPREVEPHREARTIGAEETLDEDIIGEEAVRKELAPLAETVSRRLRLAGVKAGGVRVKLKTADFQLHSRQARVASPLDSARPLLDAATSLLRHFDFAEPIRLVGITAYELTDREPIQGDLFSSRSQPRQSRLDRTVDAIQSRFGNHVLKSGSGGT